jgi:hypothetical protein
MKPSTFISLFILALLLALGVYVQNNHYQITDWWYLRNYTPPPQVASLASEASMTATGQRLFYRANPQIVTTRSEMISYCAMKNNTVIELGCYLSSDHIYLMQINESQLKDEMINTAAYEMLHSAYQRLSDTQRKQVDAQLEQIAANITDPDITQQIQLYAQTEPGERDDELFSVIGTEYPNITPDLAAEYAEYFSNRPQLVAYYQQFNQVLDGLHAEINQLNAQIISTKAYMKDYLAAGQISRYNSLVPSVNATISTYNQDVVRYNQYASDLLGQQPTAGTE